MLDGTEVTQASNKIEEEIWIQLPSTYTEEDLPVDNRDIATAEKQKSGNIWMG